VDGHLTLTTERVIFHGAIKTTVNGKPTDRIVEEAELKSISGLSCFYGTQINWIWLVVGFFMSLGALMGVIATAKLASNSYAPTDFRIAVGIGCLLNIAAFFGGILIVALLGFGKAFFLNIYSAQSAGTPISIGNAKTANHVLLSMAGLPTPETDTMMKELGAIIIDLKTDKEEALRAWGANT